MNVNAAANTKALLSALGQTGSCFPCPPPSVVVPPIGTTPFPISSEHCQRSQAIIDTIHNILAAMDTMQSFNVIGTFNVVNGAISEIISGIAAGDTVPLPSFPEVVNIVGDYISYAGERAFSGVGLIEQFSPLQSALVTAINLAGDATSAQAAYAGIINSSSASNGAKLLFNAVAYAALWSYFFDPTSTPDLSAFDGSMCGVSLIDITTCTTFASQTLDAGHTYQIVLVPPSTGLDPFYIAGDYFGWTFQGIDGNPAKGIGLYYFPSGGGGSSLEHAINPGGAAYTFAHHSAAIAIFSLDRDGAEEPYTIRICPA